MYFTMKNEDLTITRYEYLTRINNHYEDLSESEKRIADFIMKEKTEVLKMPAQELADATETSAATVVRFCRTLGFKGYTELKFYIERELLSPSSELIQINRNDSVKVLKQKIFQFNKQVIDETLDILDDNALEKAIKAIIKANKVDIYGEGGSGATALNAMDLMIQIGLHCNYYHDAYLEMTAASQLHPGDVAIAISHSGRARNTVDSLTEAKKQGATTICITGYSNSPLAKQSDIILNTSVNSSEVLSDLPAARISELSVLGVIQMGILSSNYKKHSGQIQKAKGIQNAKRYQ
jgi:DNA-binding MurR/RpiR family transcriptional regulator